MPWGDCPMCKGVGRITDYAGYVVDEPCPVCAHVDKLVAELEQKCGEYLTKANSLVIERDDMSAKNDALVKALSEVNRLLMEAFERDTFGHFAVGRLADIINKALADAGAK